LGVAYYSTARLQEAFISKQLAASAAPYFQSAKLIFGFFFIILFCCISEVGCVALRLIDYQRTRW
jgi:hypothetical protein